MVAEISNHRFFKRQLTHVALNFLMDLDDEASIAEYPFYQGGMGRSHESGNANTSRRKRSQLDVPTKRSISRGIQDEGTIGNTAAYSYPRKQICDERNSGRSRGFTLRGTF
jgi:hypothetical protein